MNEWEQLTSVGLQDFLNQLKMMSNHFLRRIFVTPVRPLYWTILLSSSSSLRDQVTTFSSTSFSLMLKKSKDKLLLWTSSIEWTVAKGVKCKVNYCLTVKPVFKGSYNAPINRSITMNNAGEMFSCEWAYHSMLHFRCVTGYLKKKCAMLNCH